MNSVERGEECRIQSPYVAILEARLGQARHRSLPPLQCFTSLRLLNLSRATSKHVKKKNIYILRRMCRQIFVCKFTIFFLQCITTKFPNKRNWSSLASRKKKWSSCRSSPAGRNTQVNRSRIGIRRAGCPHGTKTKTTPGRSLLSYTHTQPITLLLLIVCLR